MKTICPYCEAISDIHIIQKQENQIIRGKLITSDSEYSVCTACGQHFATAKQMEESLNKVLNTYREQENIIFPQEIVRIRNTYAVSQKAFAKILNLGELTINSFEQGSLPTKSVSNLIRLMEYPENFIRLFVQNKSLLSTFQTKKIEERLSHLSASM
jgi:putative zinc finger/helix-turn-helix YgiT family protein